MSFKIQFTFSGVRRSILKMIYQHILKEFQEIFPYIAEDNYVNIYIINIDYSFARRKSLYLMIALEVT